MNTATNIDHAIIARDEIVRSARAVVAGSADRAKAATVAALIDKAATVTGQPLVDGLSAAASALGYDSWASMSCHSRADVATVVRALAGA